MPKKNNYCTYRDKEGFCSLNYNEEYLKKILNIENMELLDGIKILCNSRNETYCEHKEKAIKLGIKNED